MLKIKNINNTKIYIIINFFKNNKSCKSFSKIIPFFSDIIKYIKMIIRDEILYDEQRPFIPSIIFSEFVSSNIHKIVIGILNMAKSIVLLIDANVISLIIIFVSRIQNKNIENDK